MPTRRILIGLEIVLLATSLSAQARDPIRVFIFTAHPPGGFVDADSKQRDDSVEDLKQALAKRKDLTLVETTDQADVSLEVLARGREETGATRSTASRDAFGGTVSGRTTPVKIARLHVQITAGEYAKEIVASDSTLRPWRESAYKAAKQVEDWIKENRARLLARR